MKLTRRDALAALAGTGAGLAGCAGRERSEPALPVEDLTALAVVLYPSETAGHREFVETYLDGRVGDRPEARERLAGTVGELNDAAEEWYGDEFAALSRADGDALLREVGVETAEPSRDGTLAERTRHVVNDLLYAFYSSPTGGELVGTANPPGHPGGTESYHR